MNWNFKKILTRIVCPAVVGLLAIIFGARSCTTVKPTERGVITTFGKPGNEILTPGLHFKSPIGQEIITYDISPIEYEKTFCVGMDGAISKDLQTVGVTFTLYWHYDENKILDVVKNYKTSESIYQPISSAVKAALKSEIGKYSIEEIIANQNKIASDVNTAFRNGIEYLPIVITDFKIGNYDWDESYDAMIKKTMARKQEVEQETQSLRIAEVKSQTQVKEAEARKAAATLDAESEKIKADAELYKAQQIAKAAEMKKAEWRHEEEMKRLEKWDGRTIPTYIPLAPNGGVVTLPSS